MGYAHSWYLDERRMAKVRRALPLIVADFKKFLPHLPPLAGPRGKGEAELGEGWVAFNGPEPESFEGFFFPDRGPYGLPPLVNPPWRFSFCKTGGQPYDLAVQVFLLLAKLRLGKAMRLSSDYPLADWAHAGELVEGVLGAPLDLPSLLGRTLVLFRDRNGKPFLYEATPDEVKGRQVRKRRLLEAVGRDMPPGLKPPVVLEGVGVDLPLKAIREKHMAWGFYTHS